MPSPARHNLPVPSSMASKPERQPPQVQEIDADFAPLSPPPASPAARMQWELFQRFNAERHPPVSIPYPMPVRIALLAAGGSLAWGTMYWLARSLLQAIY